MAKYLDARGYMIHPVRIAPDGTRWLPVDGLEMLKAGDVIEQFYDVGFWEMAPWFAKSHRIIDPYWIVDGSRGREACDLDGVVENAGFKYFTAWRKDSRPARIPLNRHASKPVPLP